MTIHRSNQNDYVNIKVDTNKETKKTSNKKISKELQKEINWLKEERKRRKSLSDKKNLKIKKICRAIQLRLEGNANNEVAKILGVSRNTITNYMKNYKKDHRFMLKISGYNTSELEKYESLIESLFNKEHIKSYSVAQRRVEEEIINTLMKKGLKKEELEKEISKIKISYTQFRNFLERHDFKKNYRGYLYHYQTPNVKARLKSNDKIEIKKEIDELEYLKTILKNIEDYANSFPYDDEEKLIDKIIQHFQLQKYGKEKIKKFLMNNSEYF